MTGFSREKPLAAVRWVRVGSVNEPKLAAVRSAIGAYAPDAKVEGVAVSSGVSEQPVGFEEIIRGARNRAAGAVSGPPVIWVSESRTDSCRSRRATRRARPCI